MPVRTDFILEGETLSDVSARLHVPACMLMRFNGLYSPAWLLAGREIIVPEGECAHCSFPCPRDLFAHPAADAPSAQEARASRLFAFICGPLDTLEALSARFGLSPQRLRADNRLSSPLYPGMILLIDTQQRL